MTMTLKVKMKACIMSVISGTIVNIVTLVIMKMMSLKNTSKMHLTKNKVRLKYIKNLIIIYRMIYHWIENKKKK